MLNPSPVSLNLLPSNVNTILPYPPICTVFSANPFNWNVVCGALAAGTLDLVFNASSCGLSLASIAADAISLASCGSVIPLSVMNASIVGPTNVTVNPFSSFVSTNS